MKALLLNAVLLICLLLSSCGQYGPLYMPASKMQNDYSAEDGAFS